MGPNTISCKFQDYSRDVIAHEMFISQMPEQMLQDPAVVLAGSRKVRFDTCFVKIPQYTLGSLPDITRSKLNPNAEEWPGHLNKYPNSLLNPEAKEWVPNISEDTLSKEPNVKSSNSDCISSTSMKTADESEDSTVIESKDESMESFLIESEYVIDVEEEFRKVSESGDEVDGKSCSFENISGCSLLNGFKNLVSAMVSDRQNSCEDDDDVSSADSESIVFEDSDDEEDFDFDVEQITIYRGFACVESTSESSEEDSDGFFTDSVLVEGSTTAMESEDSDDGIMFCEDSDDEDNDNEATPRVINSVTAEHAFEEQPLYRTRK